jgi:hypothetical protein
LLGFGSAATRSTPAHRTLSLVLGGAACGVAYLTAYSAFALHGYLDSTMGLGLLALTAIVAGMFAVTRGALSLGLLAMVGAYLAPILSQENPGPYVVYGYYAAISGLTLAMVAARGWRPLIHLSFLFTLVSGVFFAWNQQYYSPAHFHEMAPMLTLLAALHVAMPIVAQRNTQGAWVERVDYLYVLALPLVTTLLAVAISPSRMALAFELLCLAVIWIIAAGYLRLNKRDGAAAHAIIGALLLGFGMAARFRGAPWDVLTLTASVAALAVSVRSSQSGRLHDVLAGIVLLLGGVHAITSLGIRGDLVFLNAGFIERLIAAGLLIYAGVLARKVRQPLDSVLLYMGIGWAVLDLVAELIRWNVLSLALTLHWLAIAAAVIVSALTARLRPARAWAIMIPIAIVATAPSAAVAASHLVAVISLGAAIAALLAFALRSYEAETNAVDRIAAVIFVPVIAVLWVQRIGSVSSIEPEVLPLAAALAGVLAMFTGSIVRQRSDSWLPITAPIFGVAFAIALGYATTVSIERDVLAMLTELACLAGLVTLALDSRLSNAVMPWVRPAAVIGLALLIQANLLRWLGPDGDLNASAITRMQWPALLSLMWAATGSAFTVWSRVNGSRTLWSAGAALLVAAAIKLALVDLGELGDLTNILAVIGAGGVFLLVGWLAPMPPQTEREPVFEAARDRSGEKIGWTIAVVVSIALLLSRNAVPVDDVLEQIAPDKSDAMVYQSPWPETSPAPEPEETPPAETATALAPEPPAADTSAQIAETPSVPRTVATPAEVANECSRFVAQLPADYDLYVAGAQAGRPLDAAVGGSRGVSGMFDVDVYAPGRPIVLVLAARQPALWMVRARPGTNIAGVWLAGDNKHEVIGVAGNVPVMKGANAQRDCRSFYVSDQNSTEVRDAVFRVLSRTPVAQIVAQEGDIKIGAAPVRPKEHRPTLSTGTSEEARVASPTLPGDRGINQLLRQGKIKAATLSEYKRYVKHGESRLPSSAPGGTYLWRTYLVKGPMTFPSGLHGAHRATFILMPGVPYPEGDPGHSAVIEAE